MAASNTLPCNLSLGLSDYTSRWDSYSKTNSRGGFMRKIVVTLIVASVVSLTSVASVFAFWPVAAALYIPAAIIGAIANHAAQAPATYGYAAPQAPETYYAPEAYYAPRTYAAPTGYYAPRAYAAPTVYYAPRAYAAPPRYYAPRAYAAPTGYYAPRAYAAPIRNFARRGYYRVR